VGIIYFLQINNKIAVSCLWSVGESSSVFTKAVNGCQFQSEKYFLQSTVERNTGFSKVLVCERKEKLQDWIISLNLIFLLKLTKLNHFTTLM
jgi:hypothetical protein